MFKDRSRFSDYKVENLLTLKIADNTIVRVAGTGTVTLACGITLYEVRHLPSASRNLVSESVLTHSMGMSISKIGTNDAVIGHLSKGCPTVEVVVPWIDGLYVFTDEESKMVSPKE